MGIMQYQDDEGGSSSFNDRIQWDARAGKMFVIKRTHGALGWESEPVEISQPFSIMMDLSNVEATWQKLVNGVDVQATKVRDIIAGVAQHPRNPPSPDHKAGFRIQVVNSKLFDGVRDFSSTAFCVRQALDSLHSEYESQAEKHPDESPVITISGTKTHSSGKGTNYSPVFQITGWASRDSFDGGAQTEVPNNAPSAPAKVSVGAIPAPDNPNHQAEFSA